MYTVGPVAIAQKDLFASAIGRRRIPLKASIIGLVPDRCVASVIQEAGKGN